MFIFGAGLVSCQPDLQSVEATRKPIVADEVVRVFSEPMKGTQITFGDTVRVRTTSVTKNADLAGRIGTVFGDTTPSVTKIQVVGKVESDHAINVYFEEDGKGVWLAPYLLEFLDHGAGAEMKIEGADVKWIRDSNGNWIEVPIEGKSPKSIAK